MSVLSRFRGLFWVVVLAFAIVGVTLTATAHAALTPWASIGPQTVFSNATWLGSQIRGGADTLLDGEKTLSAGFLLTHTWSLERIEGLHEGRIYRTALLGGLKFQNQESPYWIRGGLGVGLLGGASPSFVAKAKETFFIEFARDLDSSDGSHSPWSVSLSFIYTGSASRSVSFFAENFGRDSDPTGDPSGTAPRALQVGLNLIYELKTH